MTIDVSNNNPRIEYSVAQGVTQTVFAVPFDFFEDSDVHIYVDGVLKVEGTDYTLTGGSGSTGTLTFVTATPPDVQQVTGATGGSTVVVVRHVDLERTTDFVAGQDINRAALNTQLDTIVAQIADLDDRVDRTLHVSDYEVAPSLALPSINDRKGRVIAFNASTGAVEAGPTSNNIDTIATNIAAILDSPNQAAAAAASASAALTSETNAGASKSAAAASESAAAASASAAASSESHAASSEGAAASSASAAASSASAASSSASAAASSASAAASSASSASASADAALAALDNFDDRYLGQKASDPTLDNDGNALVAGALYFNTTDDVMKVYEGSVWVAAYASLSGALLVSNNLSDVADTAASRTNLGLGTAATSATTDFATAAQGALADSAVQPNDSPTFAGLTVDTNTLYVDSTNNRVGVGTTSPAYRLDTAAASNAIGINIRGDSTNDRGVLRFSDSANSSEHFRLDVLTTGTQIKNSLSVPMQFYTNNTERMRIDSSGRVGIGTSSPSEALTVVGNGVFGDATTKYNAITINGGHVGDGDNDYGLTINSFEPAITLLDRSTGAGSSQIYGASNGGILLFGDTTNNGTIGHSTNTTDFPLVKFDPSTHTFYTGGVERMRIDSAGTVIFKNAIQETTYNLTGTALDPSNGTVQYKTLTANTTLTDSLAAGESMTLMINDGSAYTLTWPTMTWVNNGGAAPTLATSGYTVVALWKVSTTLYGALVGDGS